MRQELAKLFIDVAKYVITAVILTSMLGDLSTPVTFFIAVVIVIGCLAIAYFILRKKDGKK